MVDYYYPLHPRYSIPIFDYLWISITPKILKYDIKNVTAGSNFANVEPSGEGRFLFLAPNDIQENISHTWEPVENLITAISEKLAEARKALNLGDQSYVISSPLVYKSSNRRIFSFTTELVVYSNAKRDVFDPIEKLRKFSCPEFIGGADSKTLQSSVKPPYVFRIDTRTTWGKIVPLIFFKAQVKLSHRSKIS